MKKIMTSAIVVLSAYLTQACGAGSQESSAPKKIVGANDLVPVSRDLSNIPAEYQNVAEAVGVISMGCTGTHIGNNLVVTAGHCFKANMEWEDSRHIEGAACKDAADKDIKMGWGYRSEAGEGKNPFSLISTCLEIVVAELTDTRDYAIIRVDTAPEAALEMDFDFHASQNTEITIFSHPKTRPLEWSKSCGIKPAAHMGMAEDTQFTYTCDTEPGSSGAAVIDVDTHKVIGIHNGGGTNRDGETWNYATYSDAVPAPSAI